MTLRFGVPRQIMIYAFITGSATVSYDQHCRESLSCEVAAARTTRTSIGNTTNNWPCKYRSGYSAPTSRFPPRWLASQLPNHYRLFTLLSYRVAVIRFRYVSLRCASLCRLNDARGIATRETRSSPFRLTIFPVPAAISR